MDQPALVSVLHRVADPGDQLEPLPRVERVVGGVSRQQHAPTMNSIAKYGCGPEPVSAVPAS